MQRHEISNVMKKWILVLVVVLFFAMVRVSSAENTLAQTTSTNSIGSRSATKDTLKTQNDANRLADLKKRAEAEIDRRIAALNKLISRLGEMKKLSSEDLSNLKSQVQKDIDGLNALKIKIDADTDLTTLKEDVKSIVKDYFIFAFFMQYINLNAALDRASTVEANIEVVYGKLQARIDETTAAGKDTTQLKNLLTDMKAKLADGKTLIDSTKAAISSLTSDGYPGNKTTLMDAKTKLRTIHETLKAAHQDAKQIIQNLRLNKDKMAPTSSSAANLAPSTAPTL